MDKLISVECPVKINQKVWYRFGDTLEFVTVKSFEATEDLQRVRLVREDKDRAVWVDVKDYNNTFSADASVLLAIISEGVQSKNHTTVESVEE